MTRLLSWATVNACVCYILLFNKKESINYAAEVIQLATPRENCFYESQLTLITGGFQVNVVNTNKFSY